MPRSNGHSVMTMLRFGRRCRLGIEGCPRTIHGRLTRTTTGLMLAAYTLLLTLLDPMTGEKAGRDMTSFTRSPRSRARSPLRDGGGMRPKLNGRWNKILHVFTS